MTSKARPLSASDTIERKRHMGSKGTRILMHRSLWIMDLDDKKQYTILLLPLLFNLLTWFNLTDIIQLWSDILAYWMDALGFAGGVATLGVEMMWGTVDMPYPNMPMSLPESWAIWVNLIACIVLIIVSKLIPSKFLPLTFMLRFILIIQLTASVYFLFFPDHFPYSLGGYITQMMTMGVYLLFLIPIVLSLVFYIFDMPFWHKPVFTIMIMGYFIVAIPFQFMMHALIISSGSLLFMPALYIVFGFLLDTLMFVAMYAWGMTWPKTWNPIAAIKGYRAEKKPNFN